MIDGESAGGAAARLTGCAVTGERPLSGAVVEVTLDGGQLVVVKGDDAPGAVAAEAAGLRWLADAGAVRVPAVRGVDERWLVTDLVRTGPPSARAAVRFGRDLAALHASGVPAFGAPPPGGPADAYIGLAPMRNVPADDWPNWYAGQRVLPYICGARSMRGPCGPPRRRWWRRSANGCPDSPVPPSRPPDSTATCGTATCSGAPTATSG